jgi:hypothetical protein
VIHVNAITVDLSGLPAIASTAAAQIDAQLQTWTPAELESGWRVVELLWANLNGHTPAKEAGLRKLVAGYGALGWRVDVIERRTNQTRFTAGFAR